VTAVSWLLIRFMLAMTPLVFLINGLTKGDWTEAFFFAVAVAVGLTPEMLPMIVTANLARGAVTMSRRKVIVKNLNAIQNLGATDVLCTDKTGTLTHDKIILERHLDIHGKTKEEVLHYGYLNSFYQTGLKNLLDISVLEHGELRHQLKLEEDYRKVDEIPFDFARRRMTVVVEKERHQHLLICKGAVEELLNICAQAESDGDIVPLDEALRRQAKGVARGLNEEGMRVLVVAYKKMAEPKFPYSVADETDLTLAGFLAFLDPPKETAADAIRALAQHGVEVKVLTGDNADRSHDSNSKDPISSEPRRASIASADGGDHGCWDLHSVLAARRLSGNVALANGLFLLARGNAPGLQRADAGDQSDLHQKIQGVVVRRRNKKR